MPEIKLIDFGTAKRFHKTADDPKPLHDRVGTLSYMAPEIL